MIKASVTSVHPVETADGVASENNDKTEESVPVINEEEVAEFTTRLQSVSFDGIEMLAPPPTLKATLHDYQVIVCFYRNMHILTSVMNCINRFRALVG